MLKLKIFAVMIFLLVLPGLAVAANQGRVVGVSDGDTITVLTPDKAQIKVRLYGIDCPESKQAFGNRAKQATSDAVFGKQVTLVIMDTDRYGRSVAIVRYDGLVLQETLLKAGMAWVYDKYCKPGTPCNDWRQMQKEARANRIGLWRDKNPVPPWEWRRAPR